MASPAEILAHFVYVPNPVHKVETTEAGPPLWVPSKEKCPLMTTEERDALMAESVGVDDGATLDPRRFAVRVGPSGYEFFELKLTLFRPDGRIEVHGHPTVRVPPPILRRFRDEGRITPAGYRQLRRMLGPA